MNGNSVPSLRIESWEQIRGLLHGFFGRRGGVSDGPRATLNVLWRVGDDPRAVAENRERVQRAMPGLKMVPLRQIHGAVVVPIADVRQADSPADGMVTDTVGLGLAVFTADCVPMLMVAPSIGVVMAVHAGWRGTLAGITHAAIGRARQAFAVEPTEWQVALGPAIGGCCYEVNVEIGRELEDRWGSMPDAWEPSLHRGRLDLRHANRHMLETAGVPLHQIIEVGPCTACAADQYFSHRRSGGCAGRQVSVIGWQGIHG